MTRDRTPQQPAASTVLPEPQAWRAMIALSLGFFISLLDQTMVAVALPAIAADMGATIDQTMWVSSIYLLAVVVPLLFTGRLGDIYGQRLMFRLGVGLFAVGALLCALSPSIEWLIAARAVQGLGAAIQMPQTMSVINRVFARERRGRALGVWGIVGSLASLTGPVAGGLVVSLVGWHGVFWLHLPFAAAAIILATRWVPKLPTVARAIDATSAAVSLVAMAAIVFAVQQGPELGWRWWVWALLAAGIAGLIVFARLQATAGQRGTEPLIPPALFADRNYSLGVASISTMGFMAAAMMLPMMMWMQDVQDLPANQAGLIVVPMAVVSMLVTPFAGILVDKLHPRALSQFGFAVSLGSFVLAWWVMLGGHAAAWLALPLGLLGLGQSFIWGTNSATAMRDLPPTLMGAASGAYNTARQVGSVIGVAVVSAAMQAGQAAFGLGAGLAHSLWAIIAALAAGLVTVSFFRDTLHGGAAEAKRR
ncbi:MFS transporter [Corynebacterium sp. LK2536]|uniref:MFS transporter n=1 Tax=Corynebacterium sp. LK2536 TaxID=3110470 RepID=UPI0034CF1818